MKNLHNLDLLRTFAVSLVLLDHTSYALGYPFLGTWDVGFVGVFGVYLFFVHTCLVLMWSMERQPHVLNFYIRRIFRIYPLAITTILVALLFHIPVFAGGSGWNRMHFDIPTILANLLLVQDVVNKPNIVGVMWTLTIEVQMYVMLPALFFLASFEKKIWHIVVLWCLAVAELHQWLPIRGNILPTVIPDFLPGVVAYLAFRKYRALFPSWLFLPFVICMLAIYMRSPSPAHSWPIMLAFGLLLPRFHQISQPMFVWVSQKVAQYSYGIYLWHSFGMKISFHVIPHEAGWVKVLCEFAITAAASIASYHLIEEPLIKMGSRVAKANDLRRGLDVAA